ncbi:hypothetical protein JMJ35_001758 [Cladonia borealis]|uniref:Uncharacterized protein n=1 Tax=Cladonia borealis TaxID=184061 RepID=A0AA39R8R6_9LECA|nr:hypothetical protein JMJ35_001758 [Cladonia borealis]
MALSRTTRCLNATSHLQAFRQPMYFLRSANICGKDRTYATYVDNLPRVAQPALWHSIIPKAFRNKDNSGAPTKSQRSKDWNPATFFIWVFLLIGSNAIQMLALRHEYPTSSRKADAKIALLKEVLDKIRRGEEVDVDKVLGTGDEEQEQEWADVIKHIEEEDRAWEAKDRKREKRRLKKEEAAGRAAEETSTTTVGDPTANDEGATPFQARKPPRFY